jgi:hypothetical protein
MYDIHRTSQITYLYNDITIEHNYFIFLLALQPIVGLYFAAL